MSDVRCALQLVDVLGMSNHNLMPHAMEHLSDLLEALDWCGRRIAQGLQEEVSVPSRQAGGPMLTGADADRRQ